MCTTTHVKRALLSRRSKTLLLVVVRNCRFQDGLRDCVRESGKWKKKPKCRCRNRSCERHWKEGRDRYCGCNILIESLFVKPIPPQTSFLETMERSLRKRSEATRLGKNNIQQMMQMKPKAAEATCTGGSKWTSAELQEKKKNFCLGYKHLDLSDTNIRNVAVHYLKNDISYDDKKMFELSKQLRYQVTDDSCPAPLFTSNDISIQQVAMDVFGKKKEWVAVVNLNTQDKNGYLQSELPYCKVRNYLIGSKVEVKAYTDDTGCCDGLKDYTKCLVIEKCKHPEKQNFLNPLKDKRHKHYSKDVVVTGTQYTVGDSDVSRRRRLLTHRRSGC